MTAALRTTPQLRIDWAPPCTGPWARVTLYGGAVVTVDPLIVEALEAAEAVYRLHGYACPPGDTGAYNCRRITGGTGYSLHAYGIAVDRRWRTNPYGPRLITDRSPELVRDLKAIRTKDGHQVWGWGGDYSGNKDAMHDEIRCAPAALATGIDWSTVAGHAPAKITAVRDMAEGATGAGVKAVQWGLNMILPVAKLGDRKPLVEDGHYGPRTVARVREFERWCNAMGRLAHSTDAPLVEDGIATPNTTARLGYWVRAALTGGAR